MRDAGKGVLLGLAVLVLVGAVAERAGWIAVDLPRPRGPGPWLLVRASGFTAFAALAAEVVLGLLMSTGRGATWLPRATRVELHRWLSPLALALVGGHVAALLADDFVRFDALDVLVPFVAPTRPIALGLGVLALYAAVVVHVSFGLRKRLGARTWRRLHYLSFVTFVLAAIHGVAAGSDAGRGWAVAMFGAPLALVGGLLGIRVAIAVRELRDRAARG
jgi:sulfoxide reductase heme-binding subunit YedZ